MANNRHECEYIDMNQYNDSSPSSLFDEWSQDSKLESAMVNLIYKDQHLQILIDENLTASDFCSLVTIKLSLKKSVQWFISIRLTELFVEKVLEDWEEVLSVYKRYQIFKCVLVLDQSCNVKKFEFFDKISEYFPIKMLIYQNDKKKRTIPFGKKVSSQLNDIKTQLNCFDKLRVQVYGKLGFGLSKKQTPVLAKASFNTENGPFILEKVESSQKFFFNANNYQYFCSNNDEVNYGKFSFCLIHENCKDFNETADLVNDKYKYNYDEIIWLYADHENERNCWLTIFKLFKYGLREYRALFQEFKKQNEKNKSFSYLDISEGKVLLDYGYKDGPKVIDDYQKNLLTIVDKNKERQILRKLNKNSPSSSSAAFDLTSLKVRSSFSKFYINSYEMLFPYPLINQSDLLQPWFYLSMTREEAIKLLSKYECLDGVFLIRASQNHPLNYVLSFVHQQKVSHCQIKQIEFESTTCLSLDFGNTKFYNLQQLIEFYQLNDTCLPTKLTYFLVHRHHLCLPSSSLP